MERIAVSDGYMRVRLGTRASMPANLAFYKDLSYTVVREETHPRGPDVIVWFEKTITRWLDYMVATLPIVGRVSTNWKGTKISLEGTASALLEFTSILTRELGHIDCVLEVPEVPPRSYEVYLQIMYVRRENGKVNIHRDGDILTITGSPDHLRMLSQDISSIASRMQASLALGTQPRVEHHLDHFYLDPSSTPLVIMGPVENQHPEHTSNSE
jgi:hypothetical protein